MEKTLLERYSVLETPLRLGKAVSPVMGLARGQKPAFKGEGGPSVWVSNLGAVKGNKALTEQELWHEQHPRSHPTVSLGVPQRCLAALWEGPPGVEEHRLR